MISAIRRAVPLLVVLATACGGAAGGDDAGAAAAATSPPPEAATTAQPSQPAGTPSSQPSGVPSLQPSEGFDAATITLSSGDRRIRMPVWVADDPQLRQRGLMHRASLQANAGMLFVFEETTDGGFWMKNTRIPLSIAFIDDGGRLLEILDMQPCEADPCQVYTPGSTYRYALEANLGFFDDHGVAPGWTVDVGEALGAAG